MKNLSSRQKILCGVYSMILAMIGDYLLGYGTFSTSSSPDAYMGVEWTVAPDWRYAVSSILGFLCAALFAVAAVELLKVMAEKYQLSLLRLCFAYLHDRTLAEDAVQETFLKAYRSISGFRNKSSEKTWLSHIAINCCRDMNKTLGLVSLTEELHRICCHRL